MGRKLAPTPLTEAASGHRASGTTMPGRDALQQENGDVGDDKRGGDRRHGLQMGPQRPAINGECRDCALAQLYLRNIERWSL